MASYGLWGKFFQTNTQPDQAKPNKQQKRNLTGQTRPSRATSNGPIAGNLASQQSAKSLARLASRRSVDSAPWSAKLHLRTGPRTQHAQLFAEQNFGGITHRTCGFCSAAVLMSSIETKEKVNQVKQTTLGNHESTAGFQAGN